ncbi:hypothetical protein GX51_06166 [Blastomyces parvus]|uniref:C2H2-type domain-containing protein n=1 Tax=Blastomyces parvus TaxID=2060905 RepID=A0A2B7WSS8_9EURO|nr:hypothetical protein GX51_06166 [Blastomyces parvus]
MSGMGDKRLPTSANERWTGIPDSASGASAARNSTAREEQAHRGNNQLFQERGSGSNAGLHERMPEQMPLSRQNYQSGGSKWLDQILSDPFPVSPDTHGFPPQSSSARLRNDATHRSDSASQAISHSRSRDISNEYAQHAGSPEQAKPKLLPVQSCQVIGLGGKWKCDSCDATFARKWTLSRHRKGYCPYRNETI